MCVCVHLRLRVCVCTRCVCVSPGSYMRPIKDITSVMYFLVSCMQALTIILY